VRESDLEAIADRLRTKLDGLRYGEVSVTLTLHDGRIVETTYSQTERNKGEREKKDDPRKRDAK